MLSQLTQSNQSQLIAEASTGFYGGYLNETIKRYDLRFPFYPHGCMDDLTLAQTIDRAIGYQAAK